MRSPASHLEILERADGVFLARCPELGLNAEGATAQEAESALLRLLDERTEQLGGMASPPALESEPDALPDADE
ncbi:MAG: hypothetical protein M9921_08275 [Fimbriimonadaceae bacterium]|nr:hypothetical protein [Chthonomonadaceae bacterium]MCO5296839.1 hypothetical protein [Fimbriimonadaceae bacterium]